MLQYYISDVLTRNTKIFGQLCYVADHIEHVGSPDKARQFWKYLIPFLGPTTLVNGKRIRKVGVTPGELDKFLNAKNKLIERGYLVPSEPFKEE